MTTQHDAAIEAVARAICLELARQDGAEQDDAGVIASWLQADGTVSYLDQGEVDMFAVARAAVSACPAPSDEVVRLQSCYEQIEKAARDYADNYMLDEAADEDDCVCGREQHLRAVALFDALADVSRARAANGTAAT